MVEIKCPNCRSDVEIENNTEDKDDIKIGVFCSKEKCKYHKIPLVGLEMKKSIVFISESLM